MPLNSTFLLMTQFVLSSLQQDIKILKHHIKQLENNNERIYNEEGKSYNQIFVSAKRGNFGQACWQRKDNKHKRINFFLAAMDYNQEEQATIQDLGSIHFDMMKIEGLIHNVSRNIQLQQDMDKQHQDCNLYQLPNYKYSD
ncbi:UNKNOWN [Stylonychia lemnae]|uniref:Uncharacterized protein n=1 Tax=Stylonychia lemnae TaxID=5949 RepID=A0A077ZYS8_STYLE|nr:UNKNOWN [Stylonychia lemnae]|eukprot:CDW74772.1 UNKNOWN [Stylonychia lemnae]